MPQALWKKIADSIRQDIEAGRLRVGEKVETEAQLTKRWGVSAMTVHRAMQELQRQGWVKRQQGRGTTVAERTNKATGDVALISPNWSNNFEFDYMRGVSTSLGDEYRLIFFNDYFDVARESHLLREAVKKTDGAIFVPLCNEENSPTIKEIVNSGFPLVCLDRVPKGVEVDSVVSDNFGTSTLALRSLVERGHRKIAHFTEHDLCVSAVRERYEAFLHVMRENGEERPEDWVRVFPMGRQSGDSVTLLMQDTLSALCNREDPFTAIFCLNDSSLVIALAAAEKLNLKIPDDIEILAFNDDITLMPMLESRLNRIVQKPFQMGYEAAELLKRRINGENSGPQHICVTADFLPSQVTTFS